MVEQIVNTAVNQLAISWESKTAKSLWDQSCVCQSGRMAPIALHSFMYVHFFNLMKISH